MFQRERVEISTKFDPRKNFVLYQGDCLKLLKGIPDESLQLIVTSPPYNIGKEYEMKLKLSQYIEQQASIIKECVRALSVQGSICWQVGNHVDNGSIIPLDTILYPIFIDLGLQMRNRVV
jgi:DNA modification methylase